MVQECNPLLRHGQALPGPNECLQAAKVVAAEVVVAVGSQFFHVTGIQK